ncbi:MAG TPA: dihydroneopterin aldolase [Stellaceae bacterium]|jgi:dihydroneopterin aldolase|nr:dihydroneopterin aldolase [Stellaceae bacterium]
MTAIPLPFPAARPEPAPESQDKPIRHVFMRDLVMMCLVGVHAHEFKGPQRVRLNLDLAVHDDGRPAGDDLRNVVCYDEVLQQVRAVVEAGHVKLIETMAENIAEACLADPRIRAVRIQVEKLDVYQDMQSVGIAIERRSPFPERGN